MWVTATISTPGASTVNEQGDIIDGAPTVTEIKAIYVPAASFDRAGVRVAGGEHRCRLLRVPPGTVVAEESTVTLQSSDPQINGKAWSVDGLPKVWESPHTGRRWGIELSLIAEGAT